MRILATTWDGGGNLPPMIALCEALAERGHELIALAHRTQSAPLFAAGVEAVAYETAGEYDSGNPHTTDPAAFFAWLLAFDARAANDLKAAAARLQPDLMIVDSMTPQTLHAAKYLRSPSVSLIHCAWRTLLEIPDSPFVEPTEAADAGLVFSHRAFDAVAPRNAVWVGAARGQAAATEWRRRRPDLPFVVASLSTAQQGQGMVLDKLAGALRRVGAEGLLTVGKGYDPRKFAGSDTLAIEARVPHEAVLPKADLLITHAGHGTVMAALRSGTPMLCLPGLGDQPFNAARVVELGLGEMLDPLEVSEADIAAAIDRLLGAAVLHERARAFAPRMDEEPGVQIAVDRLEALAAQFA